MRDIIGVELLRASVDELRSRAATSQAEATRTLNPLFEKRRRRAPGDFVASSFLYLRSCDADRGSRPIPCPVFWLSPDLRAAPVNDVGSPTTELQAGALYRFSAIVRNRGDLMVPSASVEFFLVNPSLGFDVRYATRLGVTGVRVPAYGAAEASIEYFVPPEVSGHRCLFARAFSISPLDTPIDTFGLSPVPDRHIGQLNLNIVGQSQALSLDWFHLGNAMEQVVLLPSDAAFARTTRVEALSRLTLLDPRRAGELAGKLTLEVIPARGENQSIQVRTAPVEGGLELRSSDRAGISLERQGELTRQVMAAVSTLEKRHADPRAFRALFKEYRAMTAQTVRTQLRLTIPDLGLAPGEGAAFHVVRRNLATGLDAGGVTVVVSG